MAAVTGTLTVEHAGRAYVLRLTMLELAQLQDQFGDNLAGLLSGGIAVPKMRLFLRAIELALVASNPGVAPEEAARVANEMLTADFDLFTRVFTTSFPALSGGDAGNGKRAATKRA